MKKSKKNLMVALSSLIMLGMVSGCSAQGPKGDKGEQGAAGLNGSDGKDGKDGIDGKDGSKIYTGIGVPSSDKGKEGDLYIDTETGDMYYKGAVSWTKTGSIKGQNGSNGTDGTNGENGVSILGVSKTSSSDGVDTYTITYSDGHTSQFTVTNGKDGEQGVQGVPGKDGHTPTITIGENGNWFIDGKDTGYASRGGKGDKGDTGATGPQGEKGDIGEQGPKGDAGVGIASVVFLSSDGEYDTYAIYLTDGSVAGTFKIKIAKDGQNGKNGSDGEKGKDGHTPSISINEEGFWEVDGVSTGIKAKGDTGAAGKGISSVEKVSSDANLDTYRITYTDGSTSDFVITNGKDGITPHIGENGNWWIGNTDTGVKAQGAKGDKGDKGDTGAQGEKGNPGKDAVSILGVAKTGSDGLTDTYTITYSDGHTSQFTVTNGKDGKDGAAGAQGVPGKDGHTPTVTIGENGDWFVDGQDTGYSSQGKKGDKGDKGDTGAQGEKGDKGDTGAAGAQGEKGDKGEQGPKGNAGKDGSSVLLGKGEPSADLGSSGDSYIDTDTFDFYSKTESGWVKNGNLKGQKGDKGETGAQGEKGDKGDKGDTGATGAQGDKGDKGDPGKDAVTYVPCIFQNWDGSKLFEFYYEKGSTVVYTGPTPTKPSEKDGEKDVNWTFKGWDKSLENIQVPTIFTAQYECLYTCKFVNYDGSLLYEAKVNRGEDATYVGETPTKPSETNGSGSVDYVFKCWDKPLSNIRKDTTFTAVYDAPNAFECTFLNYDGTLLSKSYCSVGGTAAFRGTIPTKASESDGSGTITKYEFSGWDKSLKNIKGDMTFTAQFTSTPYYECKFVNHDGTLLYKTDTFKGGTVNYKGKPPKKSKSLKARRSPITLSRIGTRTWGTSKGRRSSPRNIVQPRSPATRSRLRIMLGARSTPIITRPARPPYTLSPSHGATIPSASIF